MQHPNTWCVSRALSSVRIKMNCVEGKIPEFMRFAKYVKNEHYTKRKKSKKEFCILEIRKDCTGGFYIVGTPIMSTSAS